MIRMVVSRIYSGVDGGGCVDDGGGRLDLIRVDVVVKQR